MLLYALTNAHLQAECFALCEVRGWLCKLGALHKSLSKRVHACVLLQSWHAATSVLSVEGKCRARLCPSPPSTAGMSYIITPAKTQCILVCRHSGHWCGSWPCSTLWCRRGASMASLAGMFHMTSTKPISGSAWLSSQRTSLRQATQTQAHAGLAASKNTQHV